MKINNLGEIFDVIVILIAVKRFFCFQHDFFLFVSQCNSTTSFPYKHLELHEQPDFLHEWTIAIPKMPNDTKNHPEAMLKIR